MKPLDPGGSAAWVSATAGMVRLARRRPNITNKLNTSKASTDGQTKAAAVTRLLSREKGATINELTKATSWQPHSCRAFLTGLRKKGHAVSREDRGEGVIAYRMTAAPSSVAAGERSAPSA